MFSSSVVLAASAAAMIATTAPAFASDSITLKGTLVADVNHDVETYVQGRRTDAKIVRSAPVDMPAFEKAAAVGGTATIEIDLDADGRLTKAAVFASSGHARIDQSAFSAVRASTYQAASVNGRAIDGSYLVDVVFDPTN
jgi:TonB family protein